MVKLKKMKSFWFLPLFLLFLFFSCSNSENVTETIDSSDSLKSLVNGKTESALWTKEIEGERLKKDISRTDYVSSSLRLTSEVMKVSSYPEDPVFPFIEGFASLDISNIPVSTIQIVKDFCSAISKDIYSGETFFNRESIFSFVFFIDDLENIFFNRKIDEIYIIQTEESLKPVFSNFILGKGFQSEHEIQIPVRFFYQTEHLDIILFVSTETNKFSQIKITGMEKANGKD
ncbi:MAG: hypothetical protein HUK25_07000 [Treponema sp.]|nr:hypothetical protein [Treponema sp.]